jgi:hypothetical protein
MSMNGDTQLGVEIPIQTVLNSLQRQIADQALRIAMLEAQLEVTHSDHDRRGSDS